MIIYNNVPNNIKKYFISHFKNNNNNCYVSTDGENLELALPEDVERFELKKDVKKYNL